jgi:hypothetical protein
MKALVPFGQRAANDVAMIIQIARNTEGTTQGSQHTASPVFLAEGLNSASLGVERHSSALRDVIDRENVVTIVVERSKVDNVEPFGVTSSFRVLSCLQSSR